MKKLTILLFCLLFSFIASAQEKKDTKIDTLLMQKQYVTECYNDSALLNCWVLQITDGKSYQYDTVCGPNWIMFNVSGTLPQALPYKFQVWNHRIPTWKEFQKFIEGHKNK